MARSRNIKPGFFQNEELGELDPLARLFFIGLWTQCDYKGCVEFRPRRLKIQILPYDNCDIESIAINLEESGLIAIYTVQGRRYIKVLNFEKHQNPHKNEKAAGSDIPDYCIESSKSMKSKESRLIAINPEQDGTDPASSLIPSSLIPDSTDKRLDQSAIDHEFERFWASGINKVNKKKSRPLFEKYLKGNSKTELSCEQLTDNLIADVQARLQSGQLGFAEMHPTTYFNGERWTDEIIDRGKNNGRHGQNGAKPSHADIVREQARRHLETLDKADREADNCLVSQDGDVIQGESERLQDTGW